MPPGGALAAVRQALRPEALEANLLIKMSRQPTRAPLPGPVQLHLFEAHLHPVACGVSRHFPVRGIQGQGPSTLLFFVEAFNDTAPRLALSVVDFPQIEHVALHHPAAPAPLALHYTPVAVVFAVFAPPIALQEHDGYRSYTYIRP